MIRSNKKRIYEDDNINMTSINIKKGDVRENVYYSRIAETANLWQDVARDFVLVNLENLIESIRNINREDIDPNSNFIRISGRDISVNISAFIRIFNEIGNNFIRNANILGVRGLNTRSIVEMMSSVFLPLTQGKILEIIRVRKNREDINSDEEMQRVVTEEVVSYVDGIIDNINTIRDVTADKTRDGIHLVIQKKSSYRAGCPGWFSQDNNSNGKINNVEYEMIKDKLILRRSIGKELFSQFIGGDRNQFRETLGEDGKILSDSEMTISVIFDKREILLELDIYIRTNEIIKNIIHKIYEMFSDEFGSQRFSSLLDDEDNKAWKSNLLTDVVRELDIDDINKEIQNASSKIPSYSWDLNMEKLPNKNIKRKSKSDLKSKLLNKIRSKFNLDSKSGREKYIDFLRSLERKSKLKRNKLRELDFDQVDSDVSDNSEESTFDYSSLDMEDDSVNILDNIIDFCKDIKRKSNITEEMKEDFCDIYKKDDVKKGLQRLVEEINKGLVKEGHPIVTMGVIFSNLLYISGEGEIDTLGRNDLVYPINKVKKNKTISLLAKTIVKLFGDELPFYSNLSVQDKFNTLVLEYVDLKDKHIAEEASYEELRQKFNVTNDKDEELDNIIENFVNKQVKDDKQVKIVIKPGDRLYEYMYKDMGFDDIMINIKSIYDRMFDKFNNKTFAEITSYLNSDSNELQGLNNSTVAIKDLFNAYFIKKSKFVKDYAAACLQYMLKNVLVANSRGRNLFTSTNPKDNSSKKPIIKYKDGDIIIRARAFAKIAIDNSELTQKDFINELLGLDNNFEIVFDSDTNEYKIHKIIKLDRLTETEFLISKDCAEVITTAFSKDVGDLDKDESTPREVDLSDRIDVNAVLQYWQDNPDERQEDGELTYAQLMAKQNKKKKAPKIEPERKPEREVDDNDKIDVDSVLQYWQDNPDERQDDGELTYAQLMAKQNKKKKEPKKAPKKEPEKETDFFSRLDWD